MSDIQQARDVLAKWRKEATVGTWEARIPERPYEEYRDIYSSDALVAWNADGDGAMEAADAFLIVGTAGNPDLLDAIDGLLRKTALPGTAFDDNGIAAAIISADERMSA